MGSVHLRSLLQVQFPAFFPDVGFLQTKIDSVVFLHERAVSFDPPKYGIMQQARVTNAAPIVPKRAETRRFGLFKKRGNIEQAISRRLLRQRVTAT